VTWDESQVSVGGLLALGYGLWSKGENKEEERQVTNYAEGEATEIGAKWAKEAEKYLNI
jgi:hypothetical protein